MYNFSYTYDIFKKAIKRGLEEKDIYEIIEDYKAKELGDLLEKEWDKEKRRKNPSILKIILRPFGRTYLGYGLMQVLMKTVLM